MFAPTNEAFATALQALNLPNIDLPTLQQQGLLEPILTNHVLAAPYNVSRSPQPDPFNPLLQSRVRPTSTAGRTSIAWMLSRNHVFDMPCNMSRTLYP